MRVSLFHKVRQSISFTQACTSSTAGYAWSPPAPCNCLTKLFLRFFSCSKYGFLRFLFRRRGRNSIQFLAVSALLCTHFLAFFMRFFLFFSYSQDKNDGIPNLKHASCSFLHYLSIYSNILNDYFKTYYKKQFPSTLFSLLSSHVTQSTVFVDKSSSHSPKVSISITYVLWILNPTNFTFYEPLNPNTQIFVVRRQTTHRHWRKITLLIGRRVWQWQVVSGSTSRGEVRQVSGCSIRSDECPLIYE